MATGSYPLIASALTVCVGTDFARMFAASIDRWLAAVLRLVVVTDLADQEASRVCADAARRAGQDKVQLVRTDAFTRHGARFNKGAALNEAVGHLLWRDWILLFDADIIPPEEWQRSAALQGIAPGTLYTANRFREDGTFISDNTEPAGYFMLFHSADRALQRRPLFDGQWTHAGNFDTFFARRWLGRWRWLDLPLVHQGEIGHWFGPGTDLEEVNETFRLREEYGSLDHERVVPPPS